MSKIYELIKKANSYNNCIVLPTSGLPTVPPQYKLPQDLLEFYSLCGGIEMFNTKAFGFTILAPEEFLPINPIIVGELCPEDISSNWFAVCKDRNGNYISIDLRDEKQGFCYDSSLETHGLVGDCAVVSKSFTELFEHLLHAEGEYIYWCEPDFISLGDAYD